MSNELDNLQKKLAQYETVFRGKEVRVGEYWTAGNTVEVYDHDEGGVIVSFEVDETGRKVLHLYECGEGFSMYEDGGYV